MSTRIERFEKAGLLPEILWEEKYPEERPGEFAATRRQIETLSEQAIFDMWLRGQNIVGYAGTIINVLDTIRRIVRRAE